MIFPLFLLNVFLLALSLINFATIRRPLPTASITESINVLLPVRNEEENIERVIAQLESQAGVQNYKVIVIDDNSEDCTFELASSLVSDRVTVIQAPSPQSGWLGKVSALHFAFSSIPKADITISVDADVHFAPDAISRAARTLLAHNLDFISPYPRQIALTWAERLTQPLLQWSWMSTLILRGAEKLPLASTVVCNGQFLVMKTSSLNAVGGFASVADKVLDDIELGRSFVSGGYKGAVIDGSSIASTRMYSSLREIREGYGKSLHAAFGSPFGSLVAALFIFLTGVLPFIYSLSGNLLAIGALLAIVGSRMISAAASSSRLRDSFLHPVSAALFIYLLYYSWSNRGKTQWKGRTL
jgi:cellulose synthase/poly-beta-1,6-N-acetylglucosamine synthase-like glycosyltransferase